MTNQVINEPGMMQDAVNLGTALPRESWVSLSKQLAICNVGKKNFQDIENALFVLSLEDTIEHNKVSKVVEQLWLKEENRWFDKGLNIIIAPSGTVGCNFNRTLIDEKSLSDLLDKVHESELFPVRNIDPTYLPNPVHLTWTTSADVDFTERLHQLQESKRGTKLDVLDLNLDIYGYRFMEEVADSPSSAYMPVLSALAYRLAHGKRQGEPIRVFNEYGASSNIRTLGLTSIISQYSEKVGQHESKALVFKGAARSVADRIEVQDNYIRLILESMQEMDQIPEDATHMKALIETSQITEPHQLSLSSFSGQHSTLFTPAALNGYGVAFKVNKDSVNMTLTGDITEGKTNAYDLREMTERMYRDILKVLPKRSEVWGLGYKRRIEEEQKREFYLNKMREWSKKRLADQEYDQQAYLDKMMPKRREVSL